MLSSSTPMKMVGNVIHMLHSPCVSVLAVKKKKVPGFVSNSICSDCVLGESDFGVLV